MKHCTSRSTSTTKTKTKAVAKPKKKTAAQSKKSPKVKTEKKPKVQGEKKPTVSTSKNSPKKNAKVEAGESTDKFDKKVSDHRLRLGSIEAILDRTLGESARENPELWDRRAYLLLVGHVFERLATNDSEIPTEELLKLAKTLGENRIAQSQARKLDEQDNSKSDSAAPPTGDVPENLANIVRQLYGVELPESVQHNAQVGGVGG